MEYASSRCPNCGAQLQVSPGAAQAACDYCGHTFLLQQAAGQAPPSPAGYRDSDAGAHQSCPACAEVIVAGAKKCKHCGEWLDRPAAQPLAHQIGRGGPPAGMNFMAGPGQFPMGQMPMMGFGQQGVSKIVAAVIAFALPIGVHRLMLGYPVIGVMQFMTCFFGIGIFWCWADGLMILTGSIRMADGRPLS